MKELAITFILLLFLPLLFIYARKVSRGHQHKWQDRGQNRYGAITYRMCLTCRIRQIRVSGPFEDDKWEECEPIPEMDAQFDENDQYIYKLNKNPDHS